MANEDEWINGLHESLDECEQRIGSVANDQMDTALELLVVIGKALAEIARTARVQGRRDA